LDTLGGVVPINGSQQGSRAVVKGLYLRVNHELHC